jgi:hypothetical protein
MNRLYSVCLIFCAFSFSSFGQLTEVKVKIIDNLQKYSDPRFSKKSASNPKKCGNDTIEYARRKASAFNTISIRKNYSLGQIYGAPQDITVYGFTFYAWAVATPPTDKTIRLICNIYKAGTDSLPSGSPLRSDTITVDSTFGGGVLTKLEKRATFKSPVTVNYPYILTVESDSSSLSAGLVANSWSAKDGDRANLLCGSVSGKWYRGLSLNIGGVTLDGDMQFYPHVSYKFGTDFKVPDCFDFKDSARFKNDNLNNVSGSDFYSLYAFYNIDQYTHRWNYGEMPWDYNSTNGIYKYNGKGNFKIRLITTLYQYRGNNPCIDTTEKILYFRPKNPLAISNINICRGDVADIKVESDTGTIIKWFRNPAGSSVHTGGNYNLGKIQKNDTFYIKAYNYACESGFTKLIVTLNDYPSHPQVSDDSICLNAKANLEAKSSIGNTEWHKDSTFLPFYTGNVYQTGSLSKDETFFVRANNNGCYSPYFKTVTAYVDNSFAPEEPIVSNDTIICLRPIGKAILKAFSKANDSLRWYNVPSGGTSIKGGKTFSYTPTGTGIFTIYVEAQKSTCASSRLGIKITVSDYPSFSQVINDERCKGDTAQVGAILSNIGTVNWYGSVTGGTAIDKGSVIRYYTAKTKNLYAEAEANGCINPTRSLVNIKINAYDSITKIDAPIVCGNAKVTLKVTAGTNVVKWFEDEAATKILTTSAAYTTPKLLVSTNYYFTVEKNGCKSPINAVLAEVLPLPVAGYNYNFITGHKISLVPSLTSGVTYKWKMGDGNTYTSKYVTHKYAVYGTYNIKLIVKNITSGCTDSTSQDVLFDFSGIKPISKQSILISPNPATQKFTVKVSSELAKGKLTIFSVDGKQVFQKNMEGESEMEISENLKSGMYIIKVEANHKVGVERLIIN